MRVSERHTSDRRLRRRTVRIALQGTAAVLWAFSAIIQWSSSLANYGSR
jgi:hypothetical protein